MFMNSSLLLDDLFRFVFRILAGGGPERDNRQLRGSAFVPPRVRVRLCTFSPTLASNGPVRTAPPSVEKRCIGRAHTGAFPQCGLLVSVAILRWCSSLG